MVYYQLENMVVRAMLATSPDVTIWRLKGYHTAMYSLFPEFDNRKVCLKCQIPKPITDFTGRHVSKNDWCRNCLKKAQENLPPGKKLCTLCKGVFDIEFFPVSVAHGISRIISWCATCDRKRANDLNKARYDPVAARNGFLKYAYGISLEEYNAMLEAQGGVCASCHRPEVIIHHRTNQVYPLMVDHDHKTGKVRGLLCNCCNRALGFMRDDPERIKLLLKYVEERGY